MRATSICPTRVLAISHERCLVSPASTQPESSSTRLSALQRSWFSATRRTRLPRSDERSPAGTHPYNDGRARTRDAYAQSHPEAIAFSVIAGVDPKVGLYASFAIAVVIAFAGGRPGMISAATGAMALVMVTLVKEHGLQYLLFATLLTGVLQILAGALRLGVLMRFVSRSVITGFVNALAILIFMAQLPELIGGNWIVYVMVAAGLGIIYLFPYVTRSIPSPLVCIVVLTGVAIWLGLDVRRVGDMGELPSTLPIFLFPEVPLTMGDLDDRAALLDHPGDCWLAGVLAHCGHRR
jgi:hypothetical protein